MERPIPYKYSGPPPCVEGDRIEMRRMDDDPDPIPTGTLGTVTYVSKLPSQDAFVEWQVGVNWDNGRTLSVIVPKDVIRRVS